MAWYPCNLSAGKKVTSIVEAINTANGASEGDSNYLTSASDISTIVDTINLLSVKNDIIYTGQECNVIFKTAAGASNPTYSTKDTTITSIEYSSTEPDSSVTTYNLNDIGTVKCWMEDTVLKLYAKSGKIILNRNSGYLFNTLGSVTFIDTSTFDTSNVTVMERMFTSCTALTSLDLSKFVTKNVTNMSYMFNACNALTSLDCSTFDTSNVTSMSFMFSTCKALTSLNISSFNTKNVTTMARMFLMVPCIEDIVDSLNSFDYSSLIDASYMFGTCTFGDVKLSLKMPKVTAIQYMFNGCTSNSIDFSGSDFSEVTDADYLFSGYKGETLNIKNLNLPKLTTCKYIFGMSSSKSKVVKNVSFTSSTWGNETTGTTLLDMMYGCVGITTVDFSGLLVPKLTNAYRLLAECTALTTVTFGDFGKEETATEIDKLLDLDSALTTVNLGNFKPADTGSASYCFEECTALTTIYSNKEWSTNTNETSVNTFLDCTSLVGAIAYDEEKRDIAYGNFTTGYFTKNVS